MAKPYMWRSADDRYHEIARMETGHLLRSWKLILRHTSEVPVSSGTLISTWGHQIYSPEYLIEAEMLMHKELKARNAQLPHLKGIPHAGIDQDIKRVTEYKKDPEFRGLRHRWEDPLGFLMTGLRGIVHYSRPDVFDERVQWNALQVQLELMIAHGLD